MANSTLFYCFKFYLITLRMSLRRQNQAPSTVATTKIPTTLPGPVLLSPLLTVELAALELLDFVEPELAILVLPVFVAAEPAALWEVELVVLDLVGAAV